MNYGTYVGLSLFVNKLPEISLSLLLLDGKLTIPRILILLLLISNKEQKRVNLGKWITCQAGSKSLDRLKAL